MNCAFISHDAKIPLLFTNMRKSRAPRADQIIYWPLQRDMQIPVLPIYCPSSKKSKKQTKHLDAALYIGQINRCSLCAVEEADKQLLPYSPLPLHDGSIWQVAQIKHILDQQDPAWREKSLVICLENKKSAAIARFLAQEMRSLCLYGEDKIWRKQVAGQIYEEYGLICHHSQEAADDRLVISTKGYCLDGIQYDWPVFAIDCYGNSLPSHLAEAILLATMNESKHRKWYRWDIIEKLRQMERLSQYYKFSPICTNHCSNKISISLAVSD
jgi:hypothetical protein